MKNIALSIFERTANKHLNKNPHKRRFIDFNKAQSFLLLYDCNTQQDNLAIIQIVNTLKSKNKKVEIIGFCKHKNSPLPNSAIIQIINKKDTGITKKPNLQIIENINSKEFDILINFSTTKVLPLMYLALYSNAPFKIGTYTTKPEIYDFILDVNKQDIEIEENLNSSNLSFIFNQIFFYLNGIKSND